MITSRDEMKKEGRMMDITVAGRITEKEGHGGLRYLELRHEGSVAHVYPHGGHVSNYQPAGQAPVLWLSQQSWFERDKPIRGGVPICWPWFGARPSDPGLPSHGVARLSEWTPGASRVTDESTAISLRCPAAAEFGASLELLVVLDDALSITLTTVNTGPAPLPLTEALHTYFAVSDISNVSITGLEGQRYIDSLKSERPVLEQNGPITFAAETDRIYIDTTEECVIHDAGLNRRVRVGKTGSRSTVVWNPWLAKAARMPDFGDDEHPEMVCVETANCGPNALELAPGEKHAISARIHVAPV